MVVYRHLFTCTVAAIALSCVRSPVAASGQGLLYVPDPANKAVDVYPAGVDRPKLIRRIDTPAPGIAPQAVAVDRRGDLYVLAGQNIFVYARGQNAPFTSFGLPTPNVGAFSIAPDGTIYLMACCGDGNIVWVLASTGKPRYSFQFADNSRFGASIANDAAGNVYVSADRNFFFYGEVLVFAPESTKRKARLIQPAAAFGLAFDPAGHLLVGDWLSGQAHVAVENTRGDVLRTIQTIVGGNFLALDPRGGDLYMVADGGNTVEFIDYATSRFDGYFRTISSGVGQIAVDPAAPR